MPQRGARDPDNVVMSQYHYPHNIVIGEHHDADPIFDAVRNEDGILSLNTQGDGLFFT